MKTPGQIAYEKDLITTPLYQDGGKRPSWDQLNEIARWSWERNPTPKHSAKTILERLDNWAGKPGI